MINQRLSYSFRSKANIDPPNINKHNKYFFFKILFQRGQFGEKLEGPLPKFICLWQTLITV